MNEEFNKAKAENNPENAISIAKDCLLYNDPEGQPASLKTVKGVK